MVHSKTNYCGHCRRVTEHISYMGEEMCKRCGKQGKKFNARALLIGK